MPLIHRNIVQKGLHTIMDSITSSTLLRLSLAMLLGGIVGLERERKHRPAGFRTYMLVCMGAALTIMLGEYVCIMMQTRWADIVAIVGGNVSDVSRFSAQVINGIGFLGAGTILVTKRHEVQGLTTAAGLWSTACLGIAIGAGFYQGVIVGFILILVSVLMVHLLSNTLLANARNVELYVEFRTMRELRPTIALLKNLLIQIYDIEVNSGAEEKLRNPSAVFTICLPVGLSHSRVLTSVADIPGVCMVEEI